MIDHSRIITASLQTTGDLTPETLAAAGQPSFSLVHVRMSMRRSSVPSFTSVTAGSHSLMRLNLNRNGPAIACDVEQGCCHSRHVMEDVCDSDTSQLRSPLVPRGGDPHFLDGVANHVGKASFPFFGPRGILLCNLLLPAAKHTPIRGMNTAYYGWTRLGGSVFRYDWKDNLAKRIG
jgi:hypothetical protein